jgi:DnaJ-class molecular chaperone
VALSVPAGAQNGRVFRLRGQGMPKLKGAVGERGDLLARIKVRVPEDLSPRELELFRELRALRPSDDKR